MERAGTGFSASAPLYPDAGGAANSPTPDAGTFDGGLRIPDGDDTFGHASGLGVVDGGDDAGHCELPEAGSELELLAWQGRPVVDGKLDEWPENLFTALQVPDDFVPVPDYPAPSGPEDFEARFAVRWTANELFFAVMVEDETHHNTESSLDVWKGDSVQLAFDMARDGTHNGFYDGDDDYEYGWALAGNQAVGVRWFSPPNSGPPMGTFHITRQGTTGKTKYEGAFKAEDLGVSSFAAGDVFGFSFLVNENDGHGPEGWLEWSSGIHPRKDPDSFGTLRLVRIPAECEGE